MSIRNLTYVLKNYRRSVIHFQPCQLTRNDSKLDGKLIYRPLFLESVDKSLMPGSFSSSF